MGSKYRAGSNPQLDRTTTEEVPVNSDGIYQSKFVMSFVSGLDKRVRDELKAQTSGSRESTATKTSGDRKFA